ncbi:Uncharacterised protein [Mycoplasmopsis citelli]|uniref:Septation ring formation regulator n=1 Tax=Mycoplasmopsis citelli TaxID=171281 RepID=A0A449B1I4_9BACT|nr:hypothetical protein [Mycoplasmopsis citelli]VEU74423.1 Uncharacterised protein [Mycoplasmopsis citelli]
MNLNYQIIYFSIIGVSIVIFLIFFFLLVLNLVVKRFVNKLENNYLNVSREQNDFVNSLKRFKALKEQNSNYEQSYNSLLELEGTIYSQKETIDTIYHQIYQLLKRKKIFLAKKTFKDFRKNVTLFFNSIKISDEVIEQVSLNWDNYEGDITDILNKLSLAREYINKNKFILSNIYSDIKNKIDQYNQKISFIDDQWNNQAKFENVSSSISNLIIDLEFLFEYLDNSKLIEFALFTDLPELFENKGSQPPQDNPILFWKNKNKFYKVKEKFNQYQVDAIKKEIVGFYKYFHNCRVLEFKNQVLNLIKNNIFKELQKVNDKLKNNFKIANFVDKKIEIHFKNISFFFEQLKFSDFDSSINLVKEILRTFFEINQILIDYEFQKQQKQVYENGFNEEIDSSLNLYFEIMQNKYLFASEYQENLLQLKSIYEQYFTLELNFIKLEKVWNRWIELICYFVEEIAINQQYEHYFKTAYDLLNKSEKNPLQTNTELSNKLAIFVAKYQYKESFKLLQEYLK